MKKQVEQLSSKKRIVKNSFWALSSSIVNRIGAVIITIILARILLPEKYGIYSIVLSLAMIFVTFADLGINQTFIRYASSALADKGKRLNSYYRYLLKIKLILSFASAALIFILAYPLSFFIFKISALFLPLLVSSFYVFLLSIEGFYSSVFPAAERFEYISIVQIFKISFLLILFYFLASLYGVIGVYIALSIASILVIIVSLYYIKKIIPALFTKSTENIDKKGIKRFVGYLTIASISAVFFSYVDSIFLGVYVSPEYVGYYRAAFSFVFGISVLLGFINSAVFPVFAKSKKAKLSALFTLSIRYLLIISIPSMFGLLLLGKYFIRLFYGYAYLPATLPLYFLAFLIPLTLCVGIVLSLFSSNEKPQILAKLVIISTIINIVLNFILIKLFLSISPIWATCGAAIATLISWIVYFILSVYYTKKHFGFSFPFKETIKPLISSIFLVASIYFSLKLFKDINIFSSLFEVLLGIFVYLFTMLIIKGITRKDLENLMLLFKKD